MLMMLEGPFHVCGGLQPQKAVGLMELEERKGTRAGWKWVGGQGWHRPWQWFSPICWGTTSPSGLVGEDCAVPVPMGSCSSPLFVPLMTAVLGAPRSLVT